MMHVVIIDSDFATPLLVAIGATIGNVVHVVDPSPIEFINVKVKMAKATKEGKQFHIGSKIEKVTRK